MNSLRHRKRSAAITLVLAGALSGCGRPDAQRDVYTSLGACSRDWPDATQCEPVKDGRFSNTYFYGPGYYGASYPSGRPRPSPNALDAVHVAGSPVSSGGSSGSRSWSGSGGSSSSVSRGGFGASGASSGG